MKISKSVMRNFGEVHKFLENSKGAVETILKNSEVIQDNNFIKFFLKFSKISNKFYETVFKIVPKFS